MVRLLLPFGRVQPASADGDEAEFSSLSASLVIYVYDIGHGIFFFKYIIGARETFNFFRFVIQRILGIYFLRRQSFFLKRYLDQSCFLLTAQSCGIDRTHNRY